MNVKNFREGLDILVKYWDKPDGHHLGAEHDQIYAYATQKPLSKDDVKNMHDLGWFQPESEDDAEYDPDDGWSAFV